MMNTNVSLVRIGGIDRYGRSAAIPEFTLGAVRLTARYTYGRLLAAAMQLTAQLLF